MTPRQEDYLRYLQTDHWKNLRQSVLKRDGFQCTRCPSRFRLQAHHKFYRPRWEDSVLEDLVTLCRNCHEVEHGLAPVAPGVAPHIAGSVGSKRWNSLGQRVSRSGHPIVFGKKRKKHKGPRNKKEWKAWKKYMPWATRAFR